MKGKILKKVIAAALVLTLVSGGVPIQPLSQVFEDIAITASAEGEVNLSTLGSYTAQDSDVLSGSTSGTVTIANNASITLSDATITGGIVCEGSATITLVGTNSVNVSTASLVHSKAGIQIGGSGTTLTIRGNGSLTATGGSAAAGIGLGRTWDASVTAGAIVIEGGTVNASGDIGIGIGTVGNSQTATIDGISIKGGTVSASLGKGYIHNGSTATVGYIKIYDTIDMVDASKITETVTYMHVDGESATDVTANKTDYFTIGENGDRRIIVPKDDTDYTITIADGIEHGTLTVAAATAKYMQTVTVTATPAFGYRFVRLIVKDAQNNDVASTNNTFQMPKGGATVSAVFEQGVHGTTEFTWGYPGPDGFVNDIYDGVTTVNLQQTRQSYQIWKYNEYTNSKFRLDNNTYEANIPYAGGTGEFYEIGNATNFSLNYDGQTGYYDITMTDVGNGKWGVSIQKTEGVIADIPDQTYTGSEITPEPLVVAGSLDLTKGTDYEYSYTNNTNVGTATVRVTFKGDYESLGSVDKTFNILPSTIMVNITGGGTVTIGDKSASDGEAFGVMSEKGANVTLTLTPESGNTVRSVEYGYTNKYGTNRSGAKLPISDGTATLTVPNDLKDGTGVTITVTFVDALVGGTDEDSAVALTDNTVTDLAGGWYKVESDITFDHTLNLLGDTHLVIADDKTMTVTPTTGKGIDSDYKLNVSGAGTLNVTGTGEYSIAIRVGSYVQTGAVVTASGFIGIRCCDDFEGDVTNDFTFSGGRLTATGTSDGIRVDNDITLSCTNGSDFIQSSSYDVLSGGTIKVADGKALTDGTEASNGMNGYSGTLTDEQITAIGGKALKLVATMDNIPDQTYTGSAITPEPTVIAGSLSLTKGTDYTYSYTNNTNVGTAKVTVTFKGNYASLGSVEKEFNIVKATPTVTAPTANTLTYNGNEQELVTAGSTDFGKVLYSLDGTNYSEEVPKGTSTGDYTVYYKVEGSDNWNAVEPQTVTAKIISYQKVEAKSATCTEDGNIEYYQGSDGKLYLLTDGVYTEISAEDTVIKATGHTYGEPVWTWAEDHSSASAKFTCVKGDDEQTVNAVVTSETIAPTYEADGKIVYTAKATINGTEYTDTKEVAIPKKVLVATVGDEKYDSLKAAVDAAKDEDIVTLYADVNDSELNLGEYSKNVTLDLNNHSVTLGTFYAGGDLTVKNGTLTCDINNANTGNNQTLTLDNAVLNAENGIQWLAKHIAVTNGSTLNLSGSSYLGGGDENGFDLTIDETSKVVLNNTVPDGYNSDLVRSEFSNYLPDGYSFSYDDNEYVYKIVNDDGAIETTPVILTYRGYHRITLNFDSWYGMVTADKSSALVDDTITLTVNPDEHYQVKSVTVNGGVVAVTSNNDGTYSFTMPDGDVTVSAEFELQKHTVNITGEHCTIIIKDSNGVVIANGSEVSYGTKVTYEAVADQGYYIGSHGTKYKTETITVDGDINKTLSMGIVRYTVSAITHDAATYCTYSPTVSGTGTVAYGEEVIFTAYEAKEGYEFIGWYYSNGKLVSTEFVVKMKITSTTSLYARYRQKSGVVTFMSNGQQQGNEFVYTDTAITEADFPTNISALYGYQFTGWDKTVEQINADLKAGKNVTVTAQFAPIQNNFTVTIQNGKTNETVDCTESTLITRVAESVEGKTFAYWRMGENLFTNNPKISFTANETCTITAVYTNNNAEAQATAAINKVNFANGNLIIKAGMSVPDGMTIVSVGIKTADNEQMSNADDNSTNTTNDPAEFAVTKTGVTANTTLYAQAYVTYTDGVTTTTAESSVMMITAGQDYDAAEKGTATIRSATYNADTKKATFNAYLTVPENAVIVKAGLVAAPSTKFDPTSAVLTDDNADYVKSLSCAEGKCAPVNYTWNKSNVNKGDTWYARAYLVYTLNNEQHIVYGSLVEFTA